MNRKKILTVFLIVTCLTAFQISIVSAEEFTPLLRVGTDDVYLTAGEENRIEISLKNTGDFDVFEVKTFLSVPATTPGISILKGAQRVFNEIGGGKTQRFYPTLYVDKDTPLGTYTLTFQVDYIKIYKQGATLPESAVVQVGVVVHNVTKPRVDIDVTIDAPDLKAGIDEKVGITVQNIGEETVYEVDAKVSSSSPYIILLRDSRFTGTILEPDGSSSFEPTLYISRSAPLGVYTLSATVTYEDKGGKEYYETFTLGINVDAVEVQKQTSIVLQGYETEPGTIQPGDTFDLNVDVACSGARAYEVKASLAFTPGTGLSPVTPTLVSMGDFEVGDVKGAGYRLIVDGDLRAGQYPATLTLSYLDVDGVPGSMVEAVTISVRGIVEFSLIGDEAVTVEVGEVAVLEADLLLVGTESVKFVDMFVEEDSVFERTQGSSEYIGAVDPDSPIPFDLNVKVREGTDPGDYSLSLGIKYTDDLNKEHEASVGMPVRVTEGTGQEPSTGSRGGFWAWLRNLLGLRP